GRDRGSPLVHRPVLFRDRLRQLRGLPGVTAPGQPHRLAIPGRRPRQRPAGIRGRVLDPRPGRRAGVPSVGRGGRRDPAVSGGRRVAAFIPLLLTLYPTGRPASRRWWSAVWASVAL